MSYVTIKVQTNNIISKLWNESQVSRINGLSNQRNSAHHKVQTNNIISKFWNESQVSRINGLSNQRNSATKQNNKRKNINQLQ